MIIRRLLITAVILAALMLVMGPVVAPVVAQTAWTRFRNVLVDHDLDVDGDADIDGTLNADAVDFDGNMDLAGTLTMNGNKIDLDADDDTSLTADTDDQVDWEIGGADVMTWMDFGASTITTDTTKHLVEILDTTNVMTGGTNTLSALNIDLGIGNSTAGTNNVYGILIDAISQDAQNTETAIEVGAGWDVGIDMNGNSIVLDSASNYPMGYASSGWEMVAGTASATATTVVATTITTPTYALCTITDGLTDNEEQKCSTTLSGANMTINVYKEDGSAADSAVNVDYIVIGQP